MQKKIIALAVAGLVSGAAFADGSSVTVYGIADVTFDTVSTSGGTAAGAKTGNYTRVSSNSSYLGFKGSEDLGNNLKAVFQFESGVTADAGGGASMFGNARDTYVGLAGGFGQVALGTLTAPTRLLGTQIDVNAGATGIGSNAALLSSKTQTAGTVGAVDFDSRQGNAIAYSTPNMSGFGATVAYVSGENKTKDSVVAKANASAWDLGATYNNGPILVGLTYADLKARDVANTDVKNTRLAGSFNFGQGSVRALWNQLKGDNSTGYGKVTTWGLGGTLNASANGKLIAQYYKANDVKSNTGDVANSGAKQFELGYEHSLSKRTMIKAVYARVSNDSAAAYNFYINGVNNVTANPGVDPSGLQVGIRHAF